MTESFRAALRETAETAPPIAVPPGLFARARRRHRQRQALALLATVALVALLVFGVYPQLQRPPAQPAQPAPPGLPTRLVHPPLFTAALGRAPLDRAVAVFAGRDSNESPIFGDSFPLTIVGPGDRYRSYERPMWGSISTATPTFVLSPDGRYLLMLDVDLDSAGGQQTLVLDLRTGRTRVLIGGGPLAWAPDGTRAILVTHPTDPNEAIVFRVVEVATGNVEQSVPAAGGLTADLLSAALSPDRSRLAIQVGNEVQLYQGGALLWRTEVTACWLAGPAAFTPTGDLALLRVPNEVRVLSGTTGAQLSSQPYATLSTMRAGQSPTARVVAWRDGVPIAVTASRVMLLSEPATVLLTAPADTSELDIATDTLTRPAATAGHPHAGPLLVRFRTPLRVGMVGLALLLLVFGAWLLVRRRTSYRRCRADSR
jgi:hypothetical protein